MQAFKSNIKYPKYEFIFVSNHDSDWWVASPQDDLHYGCSSEQRAQVLNYSLAFLQTPFYVGYDSERIHQFKFTDIWHAWCCYDAVWTLALALNKVCTCV